MNKPLNPECSIYLLTFRYSKFFDAILLRCGEIEIFSKGANDLSVIGVRKMINKIFINQKRVLIMRNLLSIFSLMLLFVSMSYGQAAVDLTFNISDNGTVPGGNV